MNGKLTVTQELWRWIFLLIFATIGVYNSIKWLFGFWS